MELKNKGNVYSYMNDILVLIGLFTVSKAFTVLIDMLNKIFRGNEYVKSDIDMMISYTLCFSITIIGFLIYKKRKEKNIEIELTIKPENKLGNNLSSFSAPMVLCGYIAIMCVGILLEPLVDMFPNSYAQMLKTVEGGIYAGITAIIIAPILEELLFRGIIQADLNNRYSIGTSIFITSIVFAVIHFNIIQSVSAFFSSIILGFIYYKGRSLWNVIAIHALNNATLMVLTYLIPEGETPVLLKNIIHQEWLYYTVYIFCLLLVLITIIMVFAISRNEKRKKESLAIIETVPEPVADKNNELSNDIYSMKNEEDTPI